MSNSMTTADNLKRLREQYKASAAKGIATHSWNRLYKAYQAAGYTLDKLIADLEQPKEVEN